MFKFQKENVINSMSTYQTGGSTAFSGPGQADGGARAVSRDSAPGQAVLQVLRVPSAGAACPFAHSSVSEYGAPVMLMALEEQRDES